MNRIMRDLQQKTITRVTYSKRRLDRLLSTFCYYVCKSTYRIVQSLKNVKLGSCAATFPLRGGSASYLSNLTYLLYSLQKESDRVANINFLGVKIFLDQRNGKQKLE